MGARSLPIVYKLINVNNELFVKWYRCMYSERDPPPSRFTTGRTAFTLVTYKLPPKTFIHGNKIPLKGVVFYHMKKCVRQNLMSPSLLHFLPIMQMSHSSFFFAIVDFLRRESNNILYYNYVLCDFFLWILKWINSSQLYVIYKIPKCLHENIPLFPYLLYLFPAFFLHLLVVHHVDEEPLQGGARGFRSRVK